MIQRQRKGVGLYEHPEGKPRGVAKGWKMFSIKNRRINVFGSVGHVVFVAATQLGCWSMNAALDMVLK